jgi:glycosyltransferase involved in cell wall biosynthesis
MFLSKAFVNQGHKIVVITSAFRNFRGYEFENGIHVYRLRTVRHAPDHSNILEMISFLVSGLLFSVKIARKHKIDKTIIFFTLPCGPIGYLLNKKFNIPYVVSLRGGDVSGLVPELNGAHRVAKRLRRAILRSSVKVVANAPGLANLSRKADPFPVQIIPNGVDTNLFYPLDDLRRNKNNTFEFLFVGRFQPQKNLFFLLDRFAELHTQNSMPFILHLVGDGPLKIDLQNHAEQLGLQDKIVWYGWVNKERLRTLYLSADCFLNPSLYEGMPNTVLEAMACGLPVIASDIPGNNDLVRHGETGFLFDLNSPNECVGVLKTLLEDSELAISMGKKGREWVMKDFTWDKVAKEYLSLFL